MSDALQLIRRLRPDLAGRAESKRTGLAVVRQLADELDPEPEHARHVRKLARSLFDQTKSLHGLGNRERRMLEAAALLHDTGLRRGVERHHKRSRDIILSHDLPGFSEEEQAIIACLARYHRKGKPQPQHRVFCELSEDARRTVCVLAGILRIADGLDRAHLSASRGLRVTLNGKACRIWVAQVPVSQTDIWGGMRKRDLFEEVFGVRVEIAPVVSDSNNDEDASQETEETA